MTQGNILILYGLPCSGKSSLVKALPDYYSIAVDTLIKRRTDDPSISDFKTMSKELMDDIISDISVHAHDNKIIEMGCLIPKESIDYLEGFLKESNLRFFNVILVADNDELERRIIKRNLDVDAGELDAIKVDGPDYISRFSSVFYHNLPANAAELDTTSKTSKQILKELTQLQQHI